MGLRPQELWAWSRGWDPHMYLINIVGSSFN